MSWRMKTYRINYFEYFLSLFSITNIYFCFNITRKLKTNTKTFDLNKKNYFYRMQITAYLPIYLLERQKVALEGIGTISLKYFNGFYETETNTLYPPAVHLIFDENVTLNDDFANHISNKLNIEITQAKLQLNDWLQHIKAELNNGNQYILPKIGYLLTKNKKITFESFNDAYFNQSNFGLKPLPNIVLNDDSFSETNKSDLENEVPQPLINVLEPVKVAENLGNILENNYQTDNANTYLQTSPQTAKAQNTLPKKPKQKIDWFWVMAIFIVLLTGLVVCATLIYFPPFKPSDVETSIIQNPSKIDSLANKQTLPDTTLIYHIIVADNLTPLKAQKKLVKLKANGILGTLLTNDSTIYVQLSVGSFLNPDSAQVKLKQTQNKYYPNAYLKTIISVN